MAGINNTITQKLLGRYGTVANSNFVVHNGLTVGPLTIDAATGDIFTTGNISAAGSFIDSGTSLPQNAASLDDATALAIALGG